MSKEANNYTTKSNSTPLPTGKGVRLIISGGGTGGHIFPAISIANAIKELCPDAEILFVGAEGRMEMQRVPDAGYRIIGLPVAGFDRKHLWKNFSVLLKLIRSQWKARSIIKEFRPQVAVGVGGYASGPTLKMAGMMGIPTLIQEQNSYAGVTNKLLAQKACKICVAYEGMEKFFHGTFAFFQKLNIVYNEAVYFAVFVFKIFHCPFFNGSNDFIKKLFAGNIKHFCVRLIFFNLVANGMH